MKSSHWRNFTAIYIAICLADIIAIQYGEQYSYMELLCKPLIMISIIGFTYKYLKEKPFYRIILFAFIFSWLGDVFLLGQSNHVLFFVAGLASFLISHLLYAAYFYKSVNKKWNQIKSILATQIFLVLLVVLFYGFMYPGLGELSFPVLFYVSAIGFMGILAVNRYKQVNSLSFWFVLLGAFSFILSDSLIGFNKFVNPIPFAHTLIMLFYCLAQYLILKGFVLDEE